MTPEERWQRIEEKHLALAQSVELLTHDIHELQKNQEAVQEQQKTMLEEQKRLDGRERKAREAMLTGIAAYLRALGNGGDESA